MHSFLLDDRFGKCLCQCRNTFLGNLLDLVAHFGILFDQTPDGLLDRRIIQMLLNSPEQIFETIYKLFRRNPRHGFDPPDTGRDGTFADNLEQPDITGGGDMRSPAQLDRIAVFDHAHPVAVLFTEKHHRTERAGLVYRTVAALFQRKIRANIVVHESLYFPDLLIGHLLEMRKVETQVFGRHQRALLLDMRTQYRTQSFMHQVCS